MRRRSAAKFASALSASSAANASWVSADFCRSRSLRATIVALLDVAEIDDSADSCFRRNLSSVASAFDKYEMFNERCYRRHELNEAGDLLYSRVIEVGDESWRSKRRQTNHLRARIGRNRAHFGLQNAQLCGARLATDTNSKNMPPVSARRRQHFAATAAVGSGQQHTRHRRRRRRCDA